MLTLHLLMIMNGVVLVLPKQCRVLNVADIMQRRKHITNNRISCIRHLNLEQCALECLLVKRCRSFNYKTKGNDSYALCELHSVNHDEANAAQFIEHETFDYFDVRDWPKEVAGTCASRPCGNKQRCLQTTPFRCTDIDCGPAPAVPEMYAIQTTTTLGSTVYYECFNKDQTAFTSDKYCITDYLHKTCNSDSTWTNNTVFCRESR